MNPLMTTAGFDTLTGRLIRRMRRLRSETCVTILTYHSVDHTETIFNSNVRHDPAEFERQMDYLAENYSPLSLREWIERAHRNDPPHRGVVVTLDDGYADSLRQALPIAFRRRIPVTIFPVTAVIGNRDLLWQHKLAWLVAHHHEARVLDALISAGYPPVPENQNVEAYVRAQFRADTPEILESLLKKLGQSGASIAAAERLYLEPEEIAQADRDLVEFGNHTHTHPFLSALSVDEQREEIILARDALSALTGYAPIALAYPFGLKRHYNAASSQIARETGHRVAMDMRRRINRPDGDPFELSRKPATTGPHDHFERILEDWPDNAEPPPMEGRA
ncbi:MAG TPA: polysaccharide deacetylase family protein [Phycisphaerae bacterium]|nr:polysaccharide deacetylase family protein [Phycisphaerae bacterium]